MNLDEAVELQRDALIKATQEIIAIRSVESDAVNGCPFGEEVGQALDCTLQIADSLGFHTINLDGYVGYAEYGSGEDYVAVLGHLDVVPEGSGWTYPPYGGEVHNDKLYGRGATDDKGPVMAALFGLAAIKNLRLPLSKRVRVIFGTNEETGSKDLQYYAAREKPPVAGFTPDASFPAIYAEKGLCKFSLSKKLFATKSPVQLLTLNAGERVNIVPNRADAVLAADEPQKLLDACSAFASRHQVTIDASLTADSNVSLVSHGKAAHASLPHQGVNAAMQLLAFLAECELPTDLLQYCQALTTAIGKETDGRSLGIAYQDDESGSLTLNAGLLRFTENQISLSCDVRFPVTWTGEQVVEKVRIAADRLGVNVESPTFGKPLFFAKDHLLVTTLQQVFCEATGSVVNPIAIGGGTYAKHLANTIAFGPQFPDQPDLCHQADEYIAVDDLLLCAKIYARAIYELAK